MYCSQCGKKVMETMLFCPFCGSPIVIPNQEVTPEPEARQGQEPAKREIIPAVEVPEAPPTQEVHSAAEEAEEPLNIQINWKSEPERPQAAEPAREEAFVPLDLGAFDTPAPHSEPEQDVDGEISELLSSQLKAEPVRLSGRIPDLTNVKNPDRGAPQSRRKANTYAPVKAFNPNDIFMDGEDEEDYALDDYEDYEDDDFNYEEPEEGSFLIRHIRGVVALSLFVVVLAIVLGWAFSDAGQMSLANANLAWRATAYERLGYDAYQAGNYTLSAGYYARALERDPDNYSCAYSAGVAYYTANDTERAAQMGKAAIQIDPSNPDGYHLLLRLYPDAAARPWEITSLLQQGYQRTGDSALNVEG